eukprot:2097699-Pyramimonas_sp.AAC.1
MMKAASPIRGRATRATTGVVPCWTIAPCRIVAVVSGASLCSRCTETLSSWTPRRLGPKIP